MLHILHQYVSLRALVLFALEGLLIAASLVAGAKLRFWNDPADFRMYTSFPAFGLQMLTLMVIFQLSFYFNDLYDLKAVRAPAEQLIRIEQSLAAASILLALVYVLLPPLLVGRGVFFISVVLSGIFIAVTRLVIERAWTAARPPERLLILGTGELARDLGREICLRPDLGIELVGFAAEDAANYTSGDLFGRPVLGLVDAVDMIVKDASISRIIVGIEDGGAPLPVRELVRLRVRGMRIDDAHTVLTALTARVWLRSVKAGWFIFSEGFTVSRITVFVKRAMDIVLSTIGFILSSPVMCLVALAIRLEEKGPIIYRQVRVGKGGKHFEVLKFRSMSVDAERNGKAMWAAANDPRVTRVGAFIRKYRLDELPQFINIIRGEMSFVGPRPERPFFVDQLRECIPYYDERHSVRPGLTGWAQIRYGYGSSVEDAQRKLEYDMFYLKNMSILFDCVIVFGTLRIVLDGQKGR
jgi:sugar transferase (PEP-CTERM system associated)